VHNVSQRHLGEPLGGAKSLLEAVSFKKATEGMGRGRVANASWERVPQSGDRGHYHHYNLALLGVALLFVMLYDSL